MTKPKKDAVLEEVLATLRELTKTDENGLFVDSNALFLIPVFESMLGRMKLDKGRRLLATAASYDAIKALKRHTEQVGAIFLLPATETVHDSLKGFGSKLSAETEELLHKKPKVPTHIISIVGNSPADQQLQNVVQGFKDRRAERQESVAQEA